MTIKYYKDHMSGRNLLLNIKTAQLSNQAEVSKLSDITSLLEDTSDGNGLAYHLEDGVLYRQTASFSVDYPIVLPVDGYGAWEGMDSVTFLTATHSGPIFTDSAGNVGAFDVSRVGLSSSGGGSLFNFVSNDSAKNSYVGFEKIYADTGASVGYCGVDMSMDLFFAGALNFDDGVTIEDCTQFTMGGASWNTGTTTADSARVHVLGDNGDLVSWGFTMNDGAGTYCFDIDSASTTTGATVFGGVKTGDVTDFKPDGKDQTDTYWWFDACVGFPQSTVNGGCYTRGNTTQSAPVAQGYTGNFQSAQAAGGNTQLNTTDTTGFANGDIVWLPNTIYAGKYTISNLVADTSFEINTTFIATAAGEYQTGWSKVAGTTTANHHNERCTMTANNELTFNNLSDAKLLAICNYSVKAVLSSDDCEFCIVKNDSEIITDSIVSRNVTTSIGQGFSQGIDIICCTDTLSFYWRNMTSATREMIFDQFNLTAK